jgi:HSP20 family protein
MSYLARRPALDLRREIDQLFDSFLSPGGSLGPYGGVEGIPLSLEMTETESGYKLSAEVPGLAPEDVDVQVDQGVLTIRGEKRRETTETKGGIDYTERSYGSFMRSVQLPPSADFSKIDANLEHGVLTVTVPKGEAARPRKIPLGSGQQAGGKPLEGQPPSQGKEQQPQPRTGQQQPGSGQQQPQQQQQQQPRSGQQEGQHVPIRGNGGSKQEPKSHGR